jgi:hypothetical protein
MQWVGCKLTGQQIVLSGSSQAQSQQQLAECLAINLRALSPAPHTAGHLQYACISPALQGHGAGQLRHV